MFDRYTVHQGPSRISVTEQRAPTDESVRLLAEMERAAEGRVIESLRLMSNVFDAVIVRERSAVGSGETFKVHYTLNGQNCTVSLRANDRATIEDQAPDIIRLLSEDIAQNVLRKAFAKAGR